jgi:F0F1-type ATP synthase membrane subunit c/vacuolar-type H+-ATPase subunit K
MGTAGQHRSHVIVCLRTPLPYDPKPIVLHFIVVMALGLVAGMFFVRQKFIIAAETVLSSQPNDPGALARLRGGYIVIWVLVETIVLYGLVLHYMGFSFAQVSPFFMGGFVLMLFMPPRRPAESR